MDKLLENHKFSYRVNKLHDMCLVAEEVAGNRQSREAIKMGKPLEEDE